jgi:FkbM family methyltransferase
MRFLKSFFTSTFYHEYLSLFSTTFQTIRRNSRSSKLEPEVALLDKFVRPGDSCIDVGGAYGRYTLPLARRVGKTGKVFTFEPGRYSFKVLSFIKRFYCLDNVRLIKKALSDQEGQIRLFSPVKKSGKIGPSLAYISEEAQENAVSELVAMTTLDSFCLANRIKEVHFIKCDTEGAELLVYKGARRLIEESHPTILSELDKRYLNRYGHSASDVEDFFRKFNYRFLVYCDGSFGEVGKIKEDGNYFFVHQSKLKGII